MPVPPLRLVARSVRVPLLVLFVIVLLGVLTGAPSLRSQRGLAAQLTPPAPPTYVPTPITPPPGPPTPSPTPGAAATATPAGSTAVTTPTVSALDFSLDAVRVSKQHDPGDLRGLA